jgi:beta-glucosidase
MDIEKLLAELTLEEKASLTAGADMWNITAIERLGIPPIRVTDGPNGARGSALLGAGAVTSACLPCGSALGATWDPAVVEEVGVVIGREARTKSCRYLLAPTINLHRSPIAGRNFECYSEDPLLSGTTAAAFVRGVQSQGVAATAKHFVANDAEFERNTMSSDVDERTLRELYLRPFELAVRDGGVLSVMTGYNRVNGRFSTENAELLTSILRDEWGFEGTVMTDWFGFADTVASAVAGLDLEMPGPSRVYGAALADAVRDGRIPEAHLDAIVRRWLTVIDRLDAWDDPEPTEESIDRPEDRVVARRAAADSCVLLANDGLLPLDASAGQRIALVGPRAATVHMMGGGSAQLAPHYKVSLRDVLADRLGDRLTFEPGCRIDKTTPPLEGSVLATPDGRQGVLVELWAGHGAEGDPAVTLLRRDTRLMFFGEPAPEVGTEFTMRATTVLTPDRSGPHVLTLAELGHAKLFVDGALAIDEAPPDAPRGTDAFGMASAEREASIELTAGQPVELVVEYSSRDAMLLYLTKLGMRAAVTGDELDAAVAAATDADVAVVLVGTSDEWESEGHDRDSMDLPGEQDELVRRVAAANPRTVVLVNSGAPVTMPWADDVAALLQVWLGGQEMAAAIDAVLFGDAEPAGRLPTTIPECLEHNPTYNTFPGENDHHRYGEGLLVGYRWYDTHELPVRFAFGHGGSYTTFAWGAPTCSTDTITPGGTVTVTVPVTNTGARRGAEVVQCYVRAPQGRLARPARVLGGWAKLWLDSGETRDALVELDERAFASWDPTSPDADDLAARTANAVMPPGRDTARTEAGWWIDAGTYVLEVGASIADLRGRVSVTSDERRIGP